jgi:hypothetical protein
MTLTSTAPHTVNNLSFVFRAPLQYSEHPDGDELQGMWSADPSLMVRVDPDESAAGVTVRISEMTVVELDGLGTGLIFSQDAQGNETTAFAVEVSGAPGAQFERVSDAAVVPLDACDSLAGPDECVPYAWTNQCSESFEGLGWYHFYERFEDSFAPVLTVDRAHRLRLPQGTGSEFPDVVKVSGVIRPLLGSFKYKSCDKRDTVVVGDGYDTFVAKSAQSTDMFAPDAWLAGNQYGHSFAQSLRYIAETRAVLGSGPGGNASVASYLFGTPEAHLAWHSEDFVVATTVFSETHLFNMGFAAWRQGYFQPVSNHSAFRATVCNLADVVNNPTWAIPAHTEPQIPFRQFCDFGPTTACGDEDDDLLEPCRLLSVNENPGLYRVAIDANMHRDSATDNASLAGAAWSGALAQGYLHADIRGNPPVLPPGGSTVAATLPIANPSTGETNVDTMLWDFTPDMHEALEGLCDVEDVSDVFVGQPVVGTYIDVSGPSKEACMMSGRTTSTSVTAMGGNSDYAAPYGVDDVARDSIINYSSLGSGHPELIAGVEYSEQLDEFGGSDVVGFDSASVAQGAACMWNPEWSHIATISTTSMRPSPPTGPGLNAPTWDYASISPWCPSGSNWLAGREYLPVVEGPGEGLYYTACADLSINTAHEPNNCVRAASSETLTISMVPEPPRMVALDEDWVGRKIRARVLIGNYVDIDPDAQIWQSDPAAPLQFQEGPTDSRSCYAAWGWKYGTHSSGLEYPEEVRGALFFANDSGEILGGDGSPGVASSCSSDALDLSGEENIAEIRPVFINFHDLPIADASVEAVVPQGATRVGVRFDVPSVGFAPYEPVISDLVIEVGVSVDPRVRSSVVLAGTTAYEFSPITGGFAFEPPRACSDGAWFRASALATSGPADLRERECLLWFAE